MKQLIDRIFSIQNEEEFNACALEVYQYQYEHVTTYREFVDQLGHPHPTHYTEIPFLPIHFFKTREIITDEKPAQLLFKSSGTGGNRSKHFVADKRVYERSFLPTFVDFAGPLEDCIIFALLPSYVDQGESSLVYMVDRLITASGHPLSGYYLDDLNALVAAMQEAKASGKQRILFGVSYALLDLAELHPDLEGVRVVETGGMKGRRKEMSKTELHNTLKAGFGVSYISSEYGMCELLSQAYSDANELFRFPKWMKFRLREVNDPYTFLENEEKTGVVTIIDLANVYSCAFIETQDLGRSEDGLLRLMGRMDHSEVRGCNLLIDK